MQVENYWSLNQRSNTRSTNDTVLNMTENRPNIPSEIRRRVLVEAGHRCAISTCRHIEVDVHHIIPWEECHKHEYENLIALCPNCHRMAHDNRIDKKSLRIYKANLRYTHDKFSQIEVDVLFELYKMQQGKGVELPPYWGLLIKRLIDAKYVDVILAPEYAHIFMNNLRADSDLYVISTAGREFVDSLRLEHEDI